MSGELHGDALLDLMLVDDANEEGGEIPARLQLTSEFTAGFMADHERLNDDENHLSDLWQGVHDTDSASFTCFDPINTLAFTRAGPIDRIELQTFCIRWLEANERHREAKQRLQDAYEKLSGNYHELLTLAIDVLIHRPAQLPMLEPGAPTQVSVETPTLGVKVTDEDVVLKKLLEISCL